MASKYIMEKLKLFLASDELVEQYIRKYGEIVNEQYIEQVMKQALASRSDTVAAVKKEGDDPVFEALFQCPACYRNEVVIYQLRSKSQAVKETLFLVPQYSGIAKYYAVDFNLLQTGVCPECLFASPDPKDWTQQNKFTGKITESQLSVHKKLLAEIRDQEQVRKSKFPGTKTTFNYFSRPQRDYARAIESIQLSIMRAELEAKFQIPATNFKIGAYTLKIADIEKKMKKDNTETLKKAEQYFTAATLKSDCPSVASEMMSIYQVIALNLFLKNKEKAAEFLKITKAALREKEIAVKEDPTSATKAALQEVDKWDRRIGNLWEYRDDPDFWKDA
jgi:DNA-directed RNA polymerase subunit M/transcription elongation factor TFIIS